MTLEESGQRVANILKKVRGIENVGLFHIVGQPNLEIEIDREHCARLRHQRGRRRGGRAGGDRRRGVLADGRGREALRHRAPASRRACATIPNVISRIPVDVPGASRRQARVTASHSRSWPRSSPTSRVRRTSTARTTGGSSRSSSACATATWPRRSPRRSRR